VFKNKLLGSRYITEITGTATLVCTKNKKKFHMGQSTEKLPHQMQVVMRYQEVQQVFRTGKHLTKHVLYKWFILLFPVEH